MTSSLNVCYKGLTAYNYTPFIPTCHIGSSPGAAGVTRQLAAAASDVEPHGGGVRPVASPAGRAAQTVNFALSRQALGEQLLDEYFKSHKASGADGGKRRPTAGDYVCSNSNLERIFLILMLQSLKEPAIQSLWLFVVFFGLKVCRARSRL